MWAQCCCTTRHATGLLVLCFIRVVSPGYPATARLRITSADEAHRPRESAITMRSLRHPALSFSFTHAQARRQSWPPPHILATPAPAITTLCQPPLTKPTRTASNQHARAATPPACRCFCCPSACERLRACYHWKTAPLKKGLRFRDFFPMPHTLSTMKPGYPELRWVPRRQPHGPRPARSAQAHPAEDEPCRSAGGGPRAGPAA